MEVTTTPTPFPLSLVSVGIWGFSWTWLGVTLCSPPTLPPLSHQIQSRRSENRATGVRRNTPQPGKHPSSKAARVFTRLARQVHTVIRTNHIYNLLPKRAVGYTQTVDGNCFFCSSLTAFTEVTRARCTAFPIIPIIEQDMLFPPRK